MKRSWLILKNGSSENLTHHPAIAIRPGQISSVEENYLADQGAYIHLKGGQSLFVLETYEQVMQKIGDAF